MQNIPVDFVSKYLDLEKKRGIVTLQVLDGREWSITYVIRINGRKPKFELSNGWKAFARANNLNLGDVCIFELIHKTEIAFRVSIFRDSDSLNHRSSQGKIAVLVLKSITCIYCKFFCCLLQNHVLAIGNLKLLYMTSS